MRRLVYALLFATLCGCPGTSNNASKKPSGAAGGTATESTSSAEEAKPKIDPNAPVDRSKLRTPWARAEVGDWQLYKTGTGKLKFVVVETTPAGLTCEINGMKKEFSLAELEADYVDPSSLDAAEFSHATREVGDRQLDCLVVKRTHGEKHNETWYSDELPLNNGVVYSELNGTVHYELIDFGFGKDAANEDEPDTGEGSDTDG